MNNYYHNIDSVNIENGYGIRCVVWVSGCQHHCDECFNPETWKIDSGIEITDDFYEEIREALSKEYCSGITITGGDPLLTHNLPVTEKLVNITKNEFHKSVWIYTGYQLETLIADSDKLKILKNIDVLVDGPFKKELSCKEYHWAGSLNQRVIDVQRTLEKVAGLDNIEVLSDFEIVFLEPSYSFQFRKKHLLNK